MAKAEGPKYIAFAQQKGGSGKTASVCWVALLLSMQHRVAVIDLDPQGGASALLGSNGQFTHGAYDLIVGGDVPKDVVVRSRIPKCMLVPATSALIMAEMDVRIQSLSFDQVQNRINKAFQSFDYVVFDCGSGLGILTSMAMSISDLVIMPLPPGELEERALGSTFEHLSRLRRDAEEISLALPIMRDHFAENHVDDMMVSSTVIPLDSDVLYKLQHNLLHSSGPDTSDPLISAYYALLHEIDGTEWAAAELEPQLMAGVETAPTPSPQKAPSRPKSRTEPKMETMTDIFDALHEKRGRQSEESESSNADPAESTPTRTQPSSNTPHDPQRKPVQRSQQAPASAPQQVQSYQSLRDIHHETLDEAPKTRTWFWIRLGLALIGVGVAIIGIFTDFIGPVVMWSAVGAVLILLIPDLILRFVLRDRE